MYVNELFSFFYYIIIQKIISICWSFIHSPEKSLLHALKKSIAKYNLITLRRPFPIYIRNTHTNKQTQAFSSFL